MITKCNNCRYCVNLPSFFSAFSTKYKELAWSFLAFIALTIFHPGILHANPVNGNFSGDLNGWLFEGGVSTSNQEAVITDTSPVNRLYQAVAVSPGEYTLSFDFFSNISTFTPQNAFPDSFFSSLYFTDDAASFNVDSLQFSSSISLFDYDLYGIDPHTGFITQSSKGPDWLRFQLTLNTTNNFIIPFFELLNLNNTPGDSTTRIDNVSLILASDDKCPNNPNKTDPGICGCLIPDEDKNNNGIIDCLEECLGLCDNNNPDFDEDGDGIPNCVEIEDGTNPCDPGSFTPKLRPVACAGANGFLSQVNIASVINHESQPLQVTAIYRDLGGTIKGSRQFSVSPRVKFDLIVNEMGLEADSYGSLCIFTDAVRDGSWSGGITLYKLRTLESGENTFSDNGEFDFALYYPFVNPKTGISTASLNTNSLGTAGTGTVANWIRITDGNPDNMQALRGRLNFYDQTGNFIDSVLVDIPNGGRFDYAGHAILGENAVGLAIFTPAQTSSSYFIETTRYLYEGIGASSSNFYTAFTIPERPATIEPISGFAELLPNQINITETVNVNPAAGRFSFNYINSLGASILTSPEITLPPRSSHHSILYGSLFSEATILSDNLAISQVSSIDSPVSSISVNYIFGQNGDLLYGFAPPLMQSAGRSQITEFNSFLGQKNHLFLFNSSQLDITVLVSIFDNAGSLLTQFERKLSPRTSLKEELKLPKDQYGIILVDSGNNFGLVVRNEVERDGQFSLPFIGR
jgi:hypothetical protein